jgi:hypothetical protein
VTSESRSEQREGVFLFAPVVMDNAPMLGLEHPLSGARYELEPDGTVTVSHGDRTGTFDGYGRWLAGELRWADPLLCVWLTTPTTGTTPAVSTAPPSRSPS